MDVQMIPYPAPPEAADRKRITAIAAHVAKNGTDIENAVLQKEQNNPKFNFLTGGEYAGFYRWSIFVAQRQYSEEVVRQLLAEHLGRLRSVLGGCLDLLTEDRRALENMLIGNTGTKESIKHIRCWITERAHSMAAIAEILASHVRNLAHSPTPTTPTKILHTIYLINDILFNSSGLTHFGPYTQMLPPAQQMPIQPLLFLYCHLAGIFHFSLRSSPDSHEKLLKLLHLWQSRNILTPSQAQEISTRMHHEPFPIQVPPVAPPFILNLPPPPLLDPYTISVGVFADIARSASNRPYTPFDISLLRSPPSRHLEPAAVEKRMKDFYRAWDDMEYESDSRSEYSRDN